MLILDKLCGGQLMILRSDVISSGTETCNQLHGVSLGKTLHPVLTQLCPRKQPNWAYCKLFWELHPLRPLSPKRIQMHHPLYIFPTVTLFKVHWKGTLKLGPGGLLELLDMWIYFHLSVENFKCISDSGWGSRQPVPLSWFLCLAPVVHRWVGWDPCQIIFIDLHPYLHNWYGLKVT